MSLKQGMEDRIKGLALEGVDIIFVHEKLLFERLSRMKIPGINKQIQMVLINDFKDFKALSLRDMKKLGWIRKEKLSVKDATQVLNDKGYDVQMEDEEDETQT